MRVGDKLYTDWLFVLSLIVFIVHQLIATKTKIAFFDSYIDDIVFFPIVLPAARAILTWIFKVNIKFSPSVLATALIYTVLLTEVVFPALSDKHTADPLDIFAYSFGLVLYKFFSEKSKLRARHKIS